MLYFWKKILPPMILLAGLPLIIAGRANCWEHLGHSSLPPVSSSTMRSLKHFTRLPVPPCIPQSFSTRKPKQIHLQLQFMHPLVAKMNGTFLMQNCEGCWILPPTMTLCSSAWFLHASRRHYTWSIPLCSSQPRVLCRSWVQTSLTCRLLNQEVWQREYARR